MVAGLWNSVLDHRFASLYCIRALLCIAQRRWPSPGLGSKSLIQFKKFVFEIYRTLLVAGGERFHSFYRNVYGRVGVCGTNVGRGTFVSFLLSFHFVYLANLLDFGLADLLCCCSRWNIRQTGDVGTYGSNCVIFAPVTVPNLIFRLTLTPHDCYPLVLIIREQLYFWTFSLASPKYRNVLCWCVGCM